MDESADIRETERYGKASTWLLYELRGAVGGWVVSFCRTGVRLRPGTVGGEYGPPYGWMFVITGCGEAYRGRTKAEAVLKFRLAHPGERLATRSALPRPGPDRKGVWFDSEEELLGILEEVDP